MTRSAAPATSVVSVVIPVLDRIDLTLACLAAVERAGVERAGVERAGDERAGDAGTDPERPVELDVIVVDNGSTDGTASRLAAEWPSVRVLRNERNQGFARGCNQGVAAARGDVVVLLNNDTEVGPGWLPPLLDALDDPTVAVAAPKLLFPDGTLQHVGLLLVDDRKRGVRLNGIHPYYRQPAELPAANVAGDRRIVTGAVLAMRRSAFDSVGGFDEGYWNGCEDVDLCLTLGEAGWRIVYVPTSVVMHHESSSGPERWTKLTENLQRLADRWADRVAADLTLLADGTTVPMAGLGAGAGLGAAAGQAAVAQSPLRLRIEGAAFGLHSLAQVNRELAVRLAARGDMLVTVHGPELPELTAADDPRLVPVVQATLDPRSAPGHADRSASPVVLRQAWPPDFTAPEHDGPLVMVQPWEYGGLPSSWVGPMRDLVDEVWCYTSWLRDCYVRSGVPADKVRVVPIGVDTDRFRPDGAALPLQTTKARRLLFVGGAVYRKGIDLVVNAYRRTFGPDDDVCLVVKTFGGATFYRGQSFDEQLRRLAADPGGPAIELIERELDQAEMAALYRACHVLVHPYRGEGFGMPIAEAMASGLATIVTGDGAAMDFCDEQTSYLVPSRRVELAASSRSLPPTETGYWLAEPDLAVLSLLLRRAVSSPEETAAKGRAGRERVVAQLGWDGIVEAVAERVRVLAGTTPVRRDADAPFSRVTEPAELDGARERTVLAPVGPQWPGWQHRLAALAAAIPASAPVTIVAHVEVPESERDATIDALVAVLDEAASRSGRSDGGPDVLAVVDHVDTNAAARLYRRVDAVLTGDDPRLCRRARAVERPAVALPSDPVLDALVRGARVCERQAA